MRRIDKWIGDRLFVPIIIRICQMANITQRRFHVLGWWLATLVQLWGMEGFILKVGAAVFALIWTLAAGLGVETKGEGRLWFRAMCLFFFAGMVGVHLTILIATGEFEVTWHYGFWPLVMAAEYALTIKTIPPRETKKAKEGRLAPASR